MLLSTLLTEGSMTQILTPVFVTVADDLRRTPANTDVIVTIRNTANVIPISNAKNLPRSLSSSLAAILSSPVTGHSRALGVPPRHAAFGRIPAQNHFTARSRASRGGLLVRTKPYPRLDLHAAEHERIRADPQAEHDRTGQWRQEE